MARTLVSSGSRFEAEIGYSRAVVDGEWIFVSGTTGFDYATMTIADDVIAQCEQVMRNIDAALQEERIGDLPKLPSAERFKAPAPAAPDPAALREAADLLNKAARPVILVGRSSRDEGAWARRVQLAEMRASGDSPGERVLAAAAADDEDGHAASLVGRSGIRGRRTGRALRDTLSRLD